ncbi:class I SAM-dependent methyltransferase [Stutzerimonas nitrititolerans]|jgi:site-specific DNA-methyltransferase (adenine-specific)|uniref:class I SAM-dependent methyltransferase n=1 Tax=Stutzerimonas nitrititolerans TaxID=2482751 RepID=UPI0028B12FC5|nr:class I SAM-dependent methyltransferase [Stutzerimonas nitrititolerans]
MPSSSNSPETPSSQVELSQYPTPAWAAAAIVRKNFPNLSANDFVVEPTCGPGRFLQAIPQFVPALGVEIDPKLAQTARELTGRRVITGDFFEVEIEERPTLVLGNPPFETKFIDKLLDRSFELLVDEGRCAMILPCYALQTAARVCRYNERWAIEQEMIPRNLYAGLQYPLAFVTFTKDKQRLMVGFSLYQELTYLQSLPRDVQEAMKQGPATWRSVVADALDMFGGEADLRQIYDYVADRRPTANPNWKEQVRKVCQETTRNVGRARYAKPEQLDLLAA